MSDLRVSDPTISSQFVALLQEQNVRLPLRMADEDVGVVLDADGRDVFTVDVNRERGDLEANLIAEWIVLAVNTCGGFKAVHTQ